MTIFVEGGGDSDTLRTKCRKAFSRLFEKAQIQNRPRVTACGGRRAAMDRFTSAFQRGESVGLLVDSEDPVVALSNLQHLVARDGWQPPQGIDPQSIHLMVRCMETWLLFDREGLAKYYGGNFNAGVLPSQASSGQAAPNDIEQALKAATRSTTKGIYSKGRHSFEILESIAPSKLEQSSGSARAFLSWLRTL